jgi:hypothetical protein
MAEMLGSTVGLDTLGSTIFEMTATEWSHAAIDAETDGRSRKISYNELIGSLDKIVGIPLAGGYKNALERQRERIMESHGDPDV